MAIVIHTDPSVPPTTTTTPHTLYYFSDWLSPESERAGTQWVQLPFWKLDACK